MKTVVDPDIPPNAGLARPLSVDGARGHDPELRARRPRSTAALQTCQRVVDLILGALAQAVPERVIGLLQRRLHRRLLQRQAAAGRRDSGSISRRSAAAAARAPTKDGLDGVHVHITNTSNLPVEALEIEYPLTLMRYELVEDSGGAGQYRGGMGLRRVYQATHDCRVRVDITRQRSQSWGLFGGGPGAHGEVEAGPGVVFDGDSAVLKAGPVVRRRDAGRRRLRPARRGASPRPRRAIWPRARSAATAKEIYGVFAATTQPPRPTGEVAGRAGGGRAQSSSVQDEI